MIPTILSVMVDYQCNYQCRHCSVGASPETKLPLSATVMHRVLDEVLSYPVNVAVFTGGEPTLQKGLLCDGIAHAKRNKLITRVVTNSWWASTPDSALRMIDQLVEAGLDEINTSYDDYHAEFVPEQNIINMVSAAHSRGMRCAIGVVSLPGSRYNRDTIRAVLSGALADQAVDWSSNVHILEDYPTPAGAGESMQLGTLDSIEKTNIGCPEVLRTLSLHPDGTIKACCGHAQTNCPDLTLGSAAEEPLEAIVERAQSNILYWLLHSAGPRRVLRSLGVERPFSSPCHACQTLLGEHRGQLLEHLLKHRDELFAREVLFGDHLRRGADVIMKNRDRVASAVRSALDRPAGRTARLRILTER